MKKLTVLLSLLCAASALNGMEAPEPKHERGHDFVLEDLPKDMQVLIIQALNADASLKDTINGIKAASMTNKALQQIVYEEYGDFHNLQGFTKLAHILADAFNTSCYEVATAFNTSIAKEYLTYSERLMKSLTYLMNMYQSVNPVASIQFSIEHGADVNYSDKDMNTPLKKAQNGNLQPSKLKEPQLVDTIKLLLEHGAKPTQAMLRLALLFHSKRPEIIELFLKYGAKPFKGALTIPIDNNNQKIVKLLLAYGAKLDQKDLDDAILDGAKPEMIQLLEEVLKEQQ